MRSFWSTTTVTPKAPKPSTEGPSGPERDMDILRQVILTSTPTELRDIQVWLKERMDAEWLKSQKESTR